MTTTRHYGIDLLKISAMLMVVMLHIMEHGGVTSILARNSHSFVYGVEQILNTFCLCAVNCFILASGYIMGARSFNVRRIVKLWGQVAWYSILITLLASIFFPSSDLDILDVVKAAMPVASNQYWFMTMYFALFITTPLLNLLQNSAGKASMKKYLFGGFLLLSLYPTLAGKDLFAIHGGYSYLWFMYLYLVGGYIARHVDLSVINWKILPALGGGVQSFLLGRKSPLRNAIKRWVLVLDIGLLTTHPAYSFAL